MTTKRRAKSKQLSPLREKALSYQAWMFFAHGSCDPPFETEEEARKCWEIVRPIMMGKTPPIGTVDQHGEISWGVVGWWLYDCPEAPFIPEIPDRIEGSDYMMLKQREALVRWGLLSEDAPNPGLRLLRRTRDYLEDIYSKGRENFTRPWTTVQSRLDDEWRLLLARLEAYRDLFKELEDSSGANV